MVKQLEELCLWYAASRSKERKEELYGISEDGTMGYRERGCLDRCDGKNKKCLNFYSPSKQNANRSSKC
jgi:hypothetical protein